MRFLRVSGSVLTDKWVSLGKDRRTAGDFIGSSRVLRELKEGPSRRRIGLEVLGSPARQGAEIFSDDGQTQIGKR